MLALLRGDGTAAIKEAVAIALFYVDDDRDHAAAIMQAGACIHRACGRDTTFAVTLDGYVGFRIYIYDRGGIVCSVAGADPFYIFIKGPHSYN